MVLKMSDKKRKWCFVSMDMKLDTLKRIDNGESVNKVASELNVGRSKVIGWKKTRTEIESWCSKRLCTESIVERKSMKTSEYEKVGEALFQWFRIQRDKGTPITGPILQKKALHFYNEFKGEGEPDFTASSGWLDRWKHRYGVKQLSICGEKLSANPNSESEFKVKFQAYIEEEGLSGEQIYNCDETGLSFRMLPTKRIAIKKEKDAAGYKKM
uniref:HTH CENPB-type domain-containing protein n=2 Tax=Cuerna arida TaxID=1464854 RepID=A0A1B6GQ91_9HEMI